MNKPKNNDSSKKKEVAAACPKTNCFVAKPTLYSSVIETQSKLKQISLSRFEPDAAKSKTQPGFKELNFPLTKQIFDYTNLVDVGLNSGTKTATKVKSKEVRSTKKPEPKLSDYYQPDFNNVQRIQMNCVESPPELTVQYDGLAISRLLNDIDNLVFK